jgi:hypothetical protein
MKLEDILKLGQKKPSAIDIMVYYCLKELSIDNNMPSIACDLKPYLKDYSHRSIQRSILNLEQYGLVTISRNENRRREKIYFNALKTPALEKKEIKKPKCGIYKIYKNSRVYVGQSRNIEKRWKMHMRQINRNIHPYFTNKESDELLYEILEECKTSELGIKEILWAQRLKDNDFEILNQENFTLI